MSKEIWIETFTGRRVNPLRMEVEDIVIEDIAGPLSRLCRFIGQCKMFYSVGQHSIHVAEMVEANMAEDVSMRSRTCLAALLHDAGEAYMSDLSRPIKYAIKDYKEMEDRLLGKIMVRFNCTGVDWPLIRRMDNEILALEAYELMPSEGKGWDLPAPPLWDLPDWTMGAVEEMFLGKFKIYSADL